MTILGGPSRILAVLLTLAIAGGSLFVVSPDAAAPFRGLDVTWGQYARPGLTRYPYVYVPGETIRFTIFALAGEIYDAVVVVRNPGFPRPWQVLQNEDNVMIPAGDQVTLEYTVLGNLPDGDLYEIDVGDSNYIESNQLGLVLGSQRFAIQEYMLQIEVDRPAYIGGDEVILTWTANNLQDGSLAPVGVGQIWVYNENGDDLRTNPFSFTAPSGSTSFNLPDLADPNFEGIVEGWFNNSAVTPVRFQWTCVGLAVSYAVRNLGFCPISFFIDNLGVIVNVGSFQYPPEGIVTVFVSTVVTNNQASPSPFDPPEPYIFVAISVWDITGTPVNTTYGAAGMRTDAHGDLTFLFQLASNIADGSTFEVRANASHPNQIWRWGATDTFMVRQAAALTLELQFDRNEYQAGDTVRVDAIPSGQGTATLTYIFQVRDTTSGTCTIAFPDGTPLATSSQALARFTYTINNNFDGVICFRVTVDDGQGNQVTSARAFTVVFGWLLVNADRVEYSAGNRITITWELVSNRISPALATYFYEVRDANGNLVTSGTATASFQFDVPTAPSSFYDFIVTAMEAGRAVQGSVRLTELTGFFLFVTFDRLSYAPGDTMTIQYAITGRSASSILPNTFVLAYGLLNGPIRMTSTSSERGQLTYVVPQGIDEGNELFQVQEWNTGAGVFEVVSIRGLTAWYATLGDVPWVVILLIVWLVIMTLLLWRQGTFAGLLKPRGPPKTVPAAPPSPSEPVHAPASSPMTVACRSCGGPIEITTSKRPIEVMCPRCGNTEMVA